MKEISYIERWEGELNEIMDVNYPFTTQRVEKLKDLVRKAQRRLLLNIVQELQISGWTDKDKSFERGMNKRLDMVGQLLSQKLKDLEG